MEKYFLLLFSHLMALGRDERLISFMLHPEPVFQFKDAAVMVCCSDWCYLNPLSLTAY